MYKLLIFFAILSVVCANLVRVPIYKNEKYTGSPEQISAFKEALKADTVAKNTGRQVYENTKTAFNNRHYGVVSVGTPPQNLTVLFDTSSGDMWFFKNNACPVNDSGEKKCPGVKGFASSQSSSFQSDDYYVFYYYDGFEVSGDWGIDQFSVGDITISPQGFVLVTRLNEDMKYYSQLEGVFGLTWTSQSSVAGTPPPLVNMINQGLLPDQVLSVYFPPEAQCGDQPQAGELIFGGSDSTLYEGDLTYVNVTNPGYWQFETSKIYFQGLNLCTKCETLIDSSTPVLSVPTITYDDINFIINATVNGDVVSVDCSTVSSLPDIVLEIPGKTLTIPSSIYIQTQYSAKGPTCTSLIANNYHTNYVLSDIFLSIYYTTYDYKNNRIGFAPLKKCVNQ